METFTPYSALAGGLLIGLSAALLLFFNGRIAGISGLARGLLGGPLAGRAWRAAFLLGMVAGAGLVYAVAARVAHTDLAPHARVHFPGWLLVAAGLLVGFGTALARGCTSGHGVCGLARFSPRSLVATATFLAVAIATTFVVRHALRIG